MRTVKAPVLALLALVALGSSPEAQSSLTISLFERYVEALRVQSGIPGMSAAIVQDGRVVWDKGFGYQDVEAKVAAAGDTPYPIADLSQTLSSTVLLRQCTDQSYLEVTDRVHRWDPKYSEADTTVAQLLSHASPSGGYHYDPARFAALTDVVYQCAGEDYRLLLAQGLLDRLGMSQSVPGADLADASSPSRRPFGAQRLERYASVIQRQAIPYKIDSRGRPVRSTLPQGTFSASTGVVSTVRDLARFDAALDDGILLASGTLSRAWQPVGSMPTGLGWFVQQYNGERIVWHFGLVRDSYSSLIVKVPARDLTLILLANSDGLAGPPYSLSEGNVTSSLFASLFLRLFVG